MVDIPLGFEASIAVSCYCGDTAFILLGKIPKKIGSIIDAPSGKSTVKLGTKSK